MALSNWDTLAFNTEGKPCNGVLEQDYFVCEIYKNWLYVKNSKMWAGGAFVEPTIALVQHGELNIAGLEINARRHDEQSAIFCNVRYGDNKMTGIGVYGYLSNLEYLKRYEPDEYYRIPPHLLEMENNDFSEFGGEQENKWGIDFWSKNKGMVQFYCEIPEPPIEKMWVGVEKQTLTSFADWLQKIDSKYASLIDFQNALRFNQGDNFFVGDSSLTKVGEQQVPIMMEILKNENH